jgi:diguanylate cyclase (GGDEF)-like protein
MLPAAATCVMQVNAEGLLMPLAAPRLPAAYREYMARNAGHFNGVPGFGDNDGEPASPNGVLCTDIATDPRWPVFRDELLAAGYSAFWAMPVVGQKGRVIGAVVIHFGERRGPDDFHRRLMEACIQLCSLSLERERAKQRIHRLAFYDVLTRLPNRSLLQAKAEQALASSAREDEQAAVLFIDLDRFKLVNDSLGHPAGDELLRKVAGRMLEGRRLADIVSRISGDEFVIVLPACDAEDAAEIVSRLQHSLHAPLRIGNAEVCPSTSIGVAMFPSDGRDMETLIHRADMAMYQTKRDGRGGYRFFDSEMNVQTQQRLSLEADLRAAIANRTLHLHYQPQVQLDTGALHGVEALARWSHPTRGNIPPVEFIPLAEDSDLMGPLTDWVLDEACAQLESWRADGLTVPNVSVNFSPTAFHNAALAAQVGERLQRHGLEPSDLTIEITESVMIDRHPGTMRVITELRALGVQLSMDDFGTGYSSLSYLHSLPVTELKLDRSFVSDLGRRDSARALSQAVVQIGLTLGLTVVAEGVETEDQRRLLEGLGCHVAQGYLLARPLAGDAFLAWMRARAG